MFTHIFSNRLKCLSRDRTLLFWSLAFPIVLTTLFSFAFSNMLEGESFSAIAVAIVESKPFHDNIPFQETIEALSSGEEPLLAVTYTSLEHANKLLLDNEIDGFVTVGEKLLLTVKKEGLNQTILKNLLDDFAQTSASIHSIITSNPEILQTNFLEQAIVRKSYIDEALINGTDANPTVSYYYSAMAMACLFSGFFGVKSIRELQPNQTTKGARRSMAPVCKIKVFLYEFTAALLLCIMISLFLLAYITLVLGIDFGTKIPAIIITCIVGCFMGLSFGSFIGVFILKDEDTQVTIFIALSLLSSFLAGLMMLEMKYLIATHVPILGYMNPATLISDAFYSLYYFDTYTRFYNNIISIIILSMIFFTITCLIVRREKYASV